MKDRGRSVVVLGAGLSGLATAYRIQEACPGARILVLEPQRRPGGTVFTERDQQFVVEYGPNGFLDSKPTTIELCRELGLGDRLVAASAAAGKNRYLLVDGQLKALPGNLKAFLTTDLLSWRGKLDLVLERFRRRRFSEADDESVDSFARRRAGKQAAEIFADALVTGIHAGDPRLLSIRAAFPRIALMEREHGSVIKGMGKAAKARRADAKSKGLPPPGPGKMWSFPEGLGLLIETLSGKLKLPPVYGVQPHRIAFEQGRGRWTVAAAGKDSWTADAVVLACPAYQQAALVADLDAELATRMSAIAYNRVAVVALGYRQSDIPMSLDGFGYIAPQRTRRDVLGVQWCSSIFPGRAPEGAVMLRAMCGGWNRAEVAGWDDDRLLAATRAELEQAMGIRAAPIFHRIVRWDRAIPQYHLGHLERVAQIESRVAQHRGLFITGNAYHGVAMNDCTGQAVEVARKVRDYLKVLG